MAVVLGNFSENKAIKVLKENIAHDVKIQTIKRLVLELEKQVELAQDIYDTFFYIKKVDKEFSDKLWNLLCLNKVNNIDINSYFAWRIGVGGYAMLSKNGVAIYNSQIDKSLMSKFNLSKEDLYRGYAPLEDYLDTFNVNDNVLEKIISELQVFLTNFNQYANNFFQSVSSYKVQDF
jgi:hypothetical protein